MQLLMKTYLVLGEDLKIMVHSPDYNLNTACHIFHPAERERRNIIKRNADFFCGHVSCVVMLGAVSSSVNQGVSPGVKYESGISAACSRIIKNDEQPNKQMKH